MHTAAPKLASIIYMVAPNAPFTIIGENFGRVASQMIPAYGGQPLSACSVIIPFVSVECNAPAAEIPNAELTVTVAGLPSLGVKISFVPTNGATSSDSSDSDDGSWWGWLIGGNSTQQ